MGYITEAVGSGQVSGVAYGLANANTPAIVWQSPAPRPNYNMPVVTSSVARNVETAFLSWIDPSSNKPTIGWGAVVGLEAATDGGIRVPAAPGTAATLGALVASGRTLYVPDFDSNTVFAFETSNNFTFPSESNLGFPGTAGGLLGIFHLVVNASGALVGSGPATNGTRAFRLTYPTSTTLGPTSTSPFIVLLVRGTTLFLVRADDIGGSQTRGRVCTGTVGGTPVCSSNDAEDVFPLDMALGEGDLLYTVAQDVASGRASLQARDATTLAVLWSVPAADSPVHGLTLDCRQPGAGTLIGEGSGPAVDQLFAVIVDSRGVDATADWPLIRHDPRNSNDRASSLVPFTCP